MSEPTVVAVPDWSAITEEILCPLCDYNLRGVAEPRCAECGYRFLWSDMLDPKRRHHPFLFEHHPRHKIWSFFRTVTATWRPWRFWRELHATQPIVVRRSVVYWFFCLLLWLVISIVGWIFLVASTYNYSLAERAILTGRWNSYTQADTLFQDMVKHRYGTLAAFLDSALPITLVGLLRRLFDAEEFVRLWVIPTILIVSWPLVSYLALHSFAITMRKAQIKSAHIWRCVVYSGDIIFWFLFVLVGVVAGMYISSPMQPEEVLRYAGLFGHIAGWLVLPIGTLRLCVAYRYYLTFERPVATVLLAQAIVFLFYLNVSMIHFWLW